jgi:hypothetical protein
MKILKIFLALFMIVSIFSFYIKLDSSEYEDIKRQFITPSQSAKPKVYWWILNGNLDTIRAKQELQAMRDAGIGGFDFFEIGVP